MRVNEQNKSMDIELREINFIMDALTTQYLYLNKNQKPEVIIFPMYKEAKTRYGNIPIQFVPDMSEIAQDIIRDGKDIAEVTPAQEAVIDKKDEEIKVLREELERLQAQPQRIETSEVEIGFIPPVAELESKTEDAILRESPSGRVPKQPPGGDIGAGSPDGMGSRDRRDLSRTRQDLLEEPTINEDEEKSFDKSITRDESGKPVVEE